MKRFSFVTGCLAVMMAASNAGAVERDGATVMPVSVSSLLGDAPSDGCYDPGWCEPLWSVYAGAVILRRESSDVFPGFSFGYEAGVDVDVRRRIGTCHELQVRYFGIDDWSDQQTFLGPFGSAGYASELHSTEINLRSRWTDRLSVLAGFRWVELHEDLDYSVVVPVPFVGNFGTHLDGRTNNHMYGGQIGADVLVWDRGGPFTLNTEMKAGIYSNLAKNGATLGFSLNDVPLGALQIANNRTRHTAFVGELGIIGRYQLTDNLAVRSGYQLLWVEGVALADNQSILPAIFGDVNTGGSLFYHGATIGGEFRW